jgi:hypothetical protein
MKLHKINKNQYQNKLNSIQEEMLVLMMYNFAANEYKTKDNFYRIRHTKDVSAMRTFDMNNWKDQIRFITFIFD